MLHDMTLHLTVHVMTGDWEQLVLLFYIDISVWRACALERDHEPCIITATYIDPVLNDRAKFSQNTQSLINIGTAELLLKTLSCILYVYTVSASCMYIYASCVFIPVCTCLPSGWFSSLFPFSFFLLSFSSFVNCLWAFTVSTRYSGYRLIMGIQLPVDQYWIRRGGYFSHLCFIGVGLLCIDATIGCYVFECIVHPTTMTTRIACKKHLV